MKILNIIAVLTIFVSFLVCPPTYAQKDSMIQKKVNKAMEDTKSAGTQDEPVSQATKEFIDSAINSQVNSTLEKKRDKEDLNIMASENCKDWIDPNKKKSSITDSIVYYKQDETIYSLDSKKQQLLIHQNGKFVTLKIVDRAIAGFHDKSPIYRGINNEKIHPDLAGMLQALSLVAANATSEWQVSFKKQSPILLKTITDTKDEVLKDYGFLGCVKEVCFVTKAGKSEILTKQSKAFPKLKSLGYFSRAQMLKFYTMCDVLDKNVFLTDNELALRNFANTCGLSIDPSYYSEINKTVSSGCSSLRIDLLPRVQNFEGSRDF